VFGGNGGELLFKLLKESVSCNVGAFKEVPGVFGFFLGSFWNEGHGIEPGVRGVGI